jgi:hypothetical protein
MAPSSLAVPVDRPVDNFRLAVSRSHVENDLGRLGSVRGTAGAPPAGAGLRALTHPYCRHSATARKNAKRPAAIPERRVFPLKADLDLRNQKLIERDKQLPTPSAFVGVLWKAGNFRVVA